MPASRHLSCIYTSGPGQLSSKCFRQNVKFNKFGTQKYLIPSSNTETVLILDQEMNFMRILVLAMLSLSGLAACGPSPQQRAFATQVETQCRAGDLVACNQRDGDPVDVARLEVACANNSIQACQAVSNYRIQQQQIQNQRSANIRASIHSMNSQPVQQYPVFQAPQVQPIGQSRQSTFIHCNQLGSYVTSCR